MDKRVGMENGQSLPEYLKQLRKSHHYRQEDIALKLNIRRQTYSHYETGRIKPSIKVLCYLAQIYEVSMEDILRHVKFPEINSAPLESSKECIEEEGGLFKPEFLSCFQSLNEKDRRETLSIMWEIMQVKKKGEAN